MLESIKGIAEKYKKTINPLIVYVIAFAFLLLNTWLINKGWFQASLVVPAILIIAAMYIFAMDKVLMLIVLLTPLAVNIRDLGVGFGISLPTEPLLIGLAILFILKSFYERTFDRKIYSQPIAIAIIINLLWIFLASIRSEFPIVSIKFLLARLWFVIPMFFMATMLFKDYRNIKRFSWLYGISLIIVIIYTTINHASYGFGKEQGHWVMSPFYNDHTAYGAAIAFFTPVFIGFTFNAKYSKTTRILTLAATLFIILGLILSSSRAAWLSLAAALGIYTLIILKIRFRTVAIIILVTFSLLWTFQFEIIDALEKNDQDSSQDLVEHIQSMTNISTDASNLERINRWQSAIRLFEERPFWGWGPGTYQFVYAPYQRAEEKTIISTNSGDMGNAHSEYLGPLAESGVLGTLTLLGIIVVMGMTSMRVYKRSQDKEHKMIIMVSMLALATYFIHGTLNNFLDSDKLSVPVWGFMAILVAMDMYHVPKKDSKELQLEE
ncbi:MAG: O-antigen ligase family protein [Bacteroidales bacterium]|nr:O-antigen ligase family protein [Bacteroidales bacterium]